MKSRATFIFSIVLSIVSLILIFIGAVFSYKLLIVSLICFLIGIIMLMRWSTSNYKWICDQCGETFEITLKQNVFGINGGVNYKRLHCPKCGKNTMCKGVHK